MYMQQQWRLQCRRLELLAASLLLPVVSIELLLEIHLDLRTVRPLVDSILDLPPPTTIG